MKPYVVLYPGKTNPHGVFLFNYVREALENRGFDVSLVSEEGLQGLQGDSFLVNRTFLPRRPDCVLSFKVWWGDEYHFSLAAKKHEIPVVMLNHGAMFVKNDLQTYKKSIFPADVACLWGEFDKEIWRQWNQKDEFIITGNPSHNVLVKPKPIPYLPEKFALLLSPGLSCKADASGERPEMQTDRLYQSAINLKKIMPVVVKTHPNANQLDFLKKHFTVYTEASSLMPLLYQSQMIISNVTSAFIPALYWQKPVFIHSEDEPGFDFSTFKQKTAKIFNFKSDEQWSQSQIDQAIVPKKKDFEIFGGPADGKAADRVVDVIEAQIRQRVNI